MKQSKSVQLLMDKKCPIKPLPKQYFEDMENQFAHAGKAMVMYTNM